MEQLYPVANETIEAAFRPYHDGTPVVWVQEEPENMGAWSFLKTWFGDSLFGRLPLSGITRPASASPATRITQQPQKRAGNVDRCERLHNSLTICQ